MTEKERTLNYNPADYAEVQKQAKGKDRKELEDFYVLTKDKSYTAPGWMILKVIFWIFLICFFIFAVSAITIDAAQYKIIKNIDEMEKEICPFLGNFQYTIQNRALAKDYISVFCWEPEE